MIVLLAPFDHEFTTWKRYLHLAVGTSKPSRSDGGSAGSGPAGFGQAGAALPRSDDDVIACDDVRECDIRALGKNRVILKQRTSPCEIIRVYVVNPKDRMGIAHAHDRRRMQHRIVDRTNLQLDGACIAKFLRERDLIPFEPWRPHVHGE